MQETTYKGLPRVAAMLGCRDDVRKVAAMAGHRGGVDAFCPGAEKSGKQSALITTSCCVRIDANLR